MIDLGIIAKGPGLMRRPIVRDIRRLREALRAADVETVIELVYVIPGRLGGADFDGFELARSRVGNRHHIIFVEVPSEAVKVAEPMMVIADLGRRAIEFAQASIPRSRASLIDFQEILRAFDDVAARIIGTDYMPLPSPSETVAGWRSESRLRPRSEIDASIEISLPVPDRAALDGAFQLERSLQDALEGSGIGFVDGNEVGDGAFVIFIHGRSLPRLRRVVKSVLEDKWTRGPATVSESSGDDS